jgi:DNA-binding transcriptional ArsR family regulator
MVKFQACKRASVDTVMIESAQDMLEALESNIDEKAKIFALLGNEVRLQIITLLLNVEQLCVCDISDILQMNQSPISQHLRKLKDGGLLQNRREGMTIYYSIVTAKKKLLQSIIGG